MQRHTKLRKSVDGDLALVERLHWACGLAMVGRWQFFGRLGKHGQRRWADDQGRLEHPPVDVLRAWRGREASLIAEHVLLMERVVDRAMFFLREHNLRCFVRCGGVTAVSGGVQFAGRCNGVKPREVCARGVGRLFHKEAHDQERGAVDFLVHKVRFRIELLAVKTVLGRTVQVDLLEQKLAVWRGRCRDSAVVRCRWNELEHIIVCGHRVVVALAREHQWGRSLGELVSDGRLGRTNGMFALGDDVNRRLAFASAVRVTVRPLIRSKAIRRLDMAPRRAIGAIQQAEHSRRGLSVLDGDRGCHRDERHERLDTHGDLRRREHSKTTSRRGKIENECHVHVD